ncbi:MAG: hypothetical protein O2955_09345 [Planctomycetota bacterium]|nr:hypothetical protein [Planctomycetota bacterium]
MGERQVQPQIAECSLCRERFLILPTNPYPAPLPAGTSRRKKKSKRANGETGISAAGLALMWKTWGRPIVVWPMTLGLAGVHKVARGGRQLGNRIVAIGKVIRAQFTLLRIVVSLIVTLIGLTVYWQVRESKLEEAMVLANAAYDRGMEALEKKDTLAALAEFEDARDAMNLLKRNDMQAHHVRQYANELSVATRLGTSSLFDVLTEGDREQKVGGGQSWNDRFTRQFKGEWLVLELKGPAIVSSGGPTSQTVVFPSVFMGKPVALELPQTIVAQVPTIGDEISLIVAVQWEECRYDDQPTPRWVVRFNPENAFLWVNFVTYEATGYVTDEFQPVDSLRQVLTQQAKWVGIESN